MSDFTESLSGFLAECRNHILEEACGNESYSQMKTRCMELSDRLIASGTPECQALLINLIDSLGGIGTVEVSYCYMCGMRDSYNPDACFNPTGDDIHTELSAIKRYMDMRLSFEEKQKDLFALLDIERRDMLDEYIKTKNTVLGIEKSYCYPGGMRDRKCFDNHFNPSAAKEWQELMDAFL